MTGEAVEGFHLSPQQRRLAKHGGRAGRVTATLAITGRVDEHALRQAAEAVVERHEALRTRFVNLTGGGLPLQVIDDMARGTSTVIVSAAEGGLHVEIDAPAMCLDAASCDALVSDLAAAYTGTPGDEPPQYADVGEWANGELERGDEHGRAHWAVRRPAAGPVPTRPTGPPAATRRLDGVGFRLGRLAGAEGVLPDAVLLTVWNEALRTTSLPEAPVIGVVRDGRRFAELRAVVGPLEAVAWVRVGDAPDEPALAAAHRLDEELTQAAAHLESLPVDGSQPPAGFRWLPERRVVPAARAEFTLESVRPFEYPFRVLLRGRIDGPDLVLEVVGVAGRPPAPGVSGLVDRVARLLGQVLDDPAQTLGRLQALSDAEAEEAFRRLNPRPRPASPPPTALVRILEHGAANPAAVAAAGAGGQLTYGELLARSASLAGRLAALGVGSEDVVGVLGHSSAAWLVAVVGVWRAGGACLAIDATVPDRRAAAQLQHVGARVAVTVTGRDAPSGMGKVVQLDAGADAGHEPADLPLPDRGALAFVTFTSGTTGRPKGVAVEHRHLASYAGAAGEALDAGSAATFASPASPAADLGATAWLVGLYHGAKVAFLPADAMYDGRRFAAAVQGSEIDVLKITPSHLSALLGAGDNGVLPRRALVLGGERLPPELVATVAGLSPGLRIFNHYGPTETTVGALVHEVDPAAPPVGDVPIGRALASAVAVPGGDGPTPSGRRAAELWLGGPSVARGYFADPRTTADRFRPDPSGAAPGGRAYRTGDLVKLDATGAAVFAGRTDDQIKVRGTRVEPAEVERELRAHGAASAVVIATGDGAAVRLDAWVTLPEGIVAGELLDRLREALPDVMVPTRVHVIDAVPRAASGKPDREALLALQGPARPAGRPPAGDLEEAVAGVFAALLGDAVADAEASFFELGGHSLLAMRAIARLRDDLGIALDVEAFFAAPTVAAVASAAEPDAAARLEVAQAVGAMTDEEVAQALQRFDGR